MIIAKTPQRYTIWMNQINENGYQGNVKVLLVLEDIIAEVYLRKNLAYLLLLFYYNELLRCFVKVQVKVKVIKKVVG